MRRPDRCSGGDQGHRPRCSLTAVAQRHCTFGTLNLCLHTALVGHTVTPPRRSNHAVNISPVISTEARPRAYVAAAHLVLALSVRLLPSAMTR